MIEELKRPEVREFILAHENDDPAALALSAAKYPDLPIPLIVKQIQSRQKAKSKLPSLHAHRDLIYPQGISLEQSSSEQTALYKSKLISGLSLTDLTGGFGIDSYFLSSVFEKVYYVEKNKELEQVVRHNFKLLGKDNIQTITDTAQSHLANEVMSEMFYYLDPARRDEYNKKVSGLEDCEPNVLTIVPGLLDRGSNVLIKLSPMLDIHLALWQLSHVKEVHVVAVDNECKEVLFLLDPDQEDPPEITAVNITGNHEDRFTFTYEDEDEIPEYSMPSTYLYEPNTAIMKAGGYHSITRQFNLRKLHRNSHLYTSDHLVEGFPGRTFKVLGAASPQKKKMKSLLPSGKSNITVRNYPQTVAQIRNKTGLAEGGDDYLFATTTLDGKPTMLHCIKASS